MKSELTKTSVAPLSRRAFVVRISPVSRVCIDIGSSNEFALGFEATIYRSGSRFSQFGRFRKRFRGVEEGSMALTSFEISPVEEIESDSYTSSTDNNAKRFTVDNGGILFTHCPRQNPPVSPSLRSPPIPSSRSHQGPRPPPARIPVVLLSPCIGHRSVWGNRGGCVRAGHTGNTWWCSGPLAATAWTRWARGECTSRGSKSSRSAAHTTKSVEGGSVASSGAYETC